MKSNRKRWGLFVMSKKSTKSKNLRQRGILLIESLAVIIAVIVALAYLNGTPEAPPDTPDTDVADFQSTVAEQATQQDATIDPNVVKTMAWQEVVNGNYRVAVAQYTLVIDANPQDTQAWMERGIAHARAGDHLIAINDYSTAAELEPSNALIYYNRGISYDALEMPELALADYDQSIGYDDQYAYTWNNRGHLYASLGEWDQAIQDYTQAVTLDPTYATAFNNRAIVYVQLGDTDSARSDYQSALEIDPYYVDANYNYGLMMYKQGDFRAAVNAFHLVVTSDIETTPQMWNNHGSALHRLGRYADAIDSYGRALGIDPTYDLARLNRATANRDLGEYEKSVQDYSELISQNPFRYDLYLARGNALERIEMASADAAISYLQYLRRNGIMPYSMQEVTESDFRTEFEIGRNQLHQFRVYVEEGDTLDFSVKSISADPVDSMIVLQKDGVILTGNDDTDQTLNASLFDVRFEQSGWVSVYIGLAGGGADSGSVQFSINPAE